MEQRDQEQLAQNKDESGVYASLIIEEIAKVANHATDDFGNAEIIGDMTPEIAEFLTKNFTFMTGEVYQSGKTKHKNTKDGDWDPKFAPLATWLKGDGKKTGLANHPVAGKKDGPAIVFGEGASGARTGNAIIQLSCATLDFDGGVSLDDVMDKVKELGVFAVIHTSFNHGTTQITLKHDDVVRKLGLEGTPDIEQVRTYLKEHSKDHFEESFLAACEIKHAKQHTKDGLQIVLETPPQDKFRVIFPLAEPVIFANLANTLDAAKGVWEDAVTGLAVNHLGANFDSTCADANRAFYTPRHPKGKECYNAILLGEPLKFEGIKGFSKSKYQKNRLAAGDPFTAGEEEEKVVYLSPSGLNLNDWHRKHKSRFQIADVIETYAADKIRNVGGERYGTLHIECPFEHEHSIQGGTATMAWNPEAHEHEVWTVFCQHDSCQGRNKLHFLQQMLEDEWFPEDVLHEELFNLPSDEDEHKAPSGADIPRRTFKDPLCDTELVDTNGWVTGGEKKQVKNASKVRAQMRQSMSEMFSFVIVEGGDARVALHPSRGEAVPFWKDTALSKAFKNRRAYYLEDSKKREIDPAAEFMLDPVRKTYLATQFEPDPAKASPDHFNLWTGFKAEPVEGDWSLLRDHIRNQIIADNCNTVEEEEALFNWFMTWLADLFQHPGAKPGCAVALLGEQGTGKSKLFDHLRAAVGAAAVKVSNRKHLVGNFNAHFDAKLLCVAEEAFWSGDKDAAGVLKDLITSDKINIERKGVDQAERSNYLRFAFVSNEKWVIPTDDNADARRFLVLRVNNNKKEDAEHFAAIDHQMANGGLEAMVHELMHWNPADHGLTWVALRKPPMTKAKLEQASYGLSGPKAVLVQIIEAGVLSGVAKDGTPFTYDLSEDATTEVLKEHLVAAIQGRDTHGGAGKATGEAIKAILGDEADQGDSKKGIEFCNPHQISNGDQGLVVKKGRWVAVPPLGGLRGTLAEKYG